MDEYTIQLIDNARSLYKDIVVGANSRITRGQRLWDLFEQAVKVCSVDAKSGDRQLGERINELAVAKSLAEDKGLQGTITYEPELLPDGRKIDFVADRGHDNAYIEVKTVHPDIADTEVAWENYLKRRKLHPPNADFVTKKDWMGGRIYGNTFASRSRFLDYTLDFETRLAEAKKIRSGPALLVFCGNGVRWRRSDLEDFADFYHSGKHRQDDPFRLMEDHHIESEKLEILRNVDNFGCITRRWEEAAINAFIWPVRGPSFGGVIR
jgi:hypothetical protein